MIKIDCGMPETCNACFATQDCDYELYCGIIGDNVDDYARENIKPDNCPCVEID